MRSRNIIFRLHAIERMFQRQFSENDIRSVLASGEIVEDYPDDKPYPSQLILGWRGARPVHVVAAYNNTERQTIVITVYEPSLDQWEPGFMRRKL